MSEYKQIWFPSGSPLGGDAQAGRGAFTKRHLHIDYIPLGDSGDPALTVLSNPQDITGLDVPALKAEAGINSQGDAVLIEKFSTTGAFLTGEFQGADVFSVEGDGDIWNTGTMYAHKANVGGIAVAADGTTELDMTLGNLFTSTPSQNTVWSTVAPTNGIGGELATFVVDNSGGHTVSWGSGYTNVDAIGAGDTGISVRTLQFDGATWHQVAATLDGEAVNAGDITISGTHGDIPFVDSAGNDLDLLAAELGAGFLVLNSRGPGLDPVWLDVQALIAFITGGLNVLTLQVFDVIIASITGVTAVDSSGAPTSEDDVLSVILAAYAAVTAVDSSGAAATSNESMSPNIPAFSFATQITAIVRILTLQVFDVIIASITGVTAVDSSGAPASESDAVSVILAAYSAVTAVDSSGAVATSSESMSPNVPAFSFSTQIIP